MKNNFLSSIEIENRIIQFFDKLHSFNRTNEILSVLSSPGKSNKKLTDIKRVEFKSNKYFNLIRVLCLYHYGTFSQGMLSYLALEVTTKLDKNFEFHWMKILFESKAFFLKWLLLNQTLSFNTFFGNILSIESFRELQQLISVHFYSEFQRPVKKAQFIRGFRDKGSAKDPSSSARDAANRSPDFDERLKSIIRDELFLFERDAFREFLILEDMTLDVEQLVKFRLIKKENIINVTKELESRKD